MEIKQAGTLKYKTIHSTDYSLQKTIETELLDLVKKTDSNWQIDTDVYSGLVERISGLFNDEN